jgi:hypothetical protein
MSIGAAEDLIPQSVGAIVLPLVDPLELRTIENLRLLTAARSAALARGDRYPQIILLTTADVDLLNVVVGQDLGGWCFSPRGGPPDVVIDSGRLL